MKISDFYFRFVGSGHYRISYFSPITNKEWHRTTTNMTIIDEFKGTEENMQYYDKNSEWVKNFKEEMQSLYY